MTIPTQNEPEGRIPSPVPPGDAQGEAPHPTGAGEFRGRGSRWAAAFETLLLGLILIGVAFRFSWSNWNQDADLHPDEYGLTSTLSHMSVPASFADYINTRLSPLSPYQKYDLQGNPTELGPDNRMRWGQWPITLVRVTAEWSDNSGYRDLRLWGRSLSALADTLGLLFIFLIGARLYGRRVGLLAAALSALAVMQIQQSHFMTSDNFALLFSTAAMYCAVRAAEPMARRSFLAWDWLWYAWFGIAFGMAVASRVNLALLAVEIVIAGVVALAREGRLRTLRLSEAAGLLTRLALAGALSLIVFRLTQPMSFRATSGDTTLLTLHLNSDWTDSMAVASNESRGIGGGPPGEQWTNRPAVVFPWVNMVLWGLGLPLGLAAWAGLALAFWRTLRYREWAAHLLPLTWAGGYFLFMSTRFVKSIRYFLPIYPFMALFAAWLLMWLWRRSRTAGEPSPWRAVPRFRLAQIGAAVAITIVVGGTLAWAWSFTGIYRVDNTRIQASHWIYQNVSGPVNLVLSSAQGDYNEPLALPFGSVDGNAAASVIQFEPHVTGVTRSILLPHVRAESGGAGATLVEIVLSTSPDGSVPLATAHIPVPAVAGDVRGQSVEASFGPAIVNAGTTYFLVLSTVPGHVVAVSGAAVANESWDEGLPLRIEGRDAFGGLYAGLMVENRWPDDAHKLDMFLQVLDQADYLFLPSQRGLWTPTRLPRSYPLTVEYYRALFDGRLGFDLAAAFSSPIRLGPLYISDVAGSAAWGHAPALPVDNDNLLAAEEAFSVYDHAPVWIFRKRPDFSIQQVREVLEAVDLTRVVPADPRNPGQADTQLLLPPERLAEQRSGGTWSDMFSRESLLNRFPLLGVVAWWLWVVITGWAFLPFAAIALRGLPDMGYSVAKIGGWLFVTWTSWMLASLRVPFVRVTLAGLWLGLVAAGIALVLLQRRKWIGALRDHWRTWLIMEGVFLALFLFDLLIRLGNSDLWHPAFGGEKPMDFSYLNAVIRSTSFPPFDPWFAGGYINYYYYGFVVAAIPIKLLGIVPSVAYNLTLPTLFALVGSAGFGLAWSLATHMRREGRPGLSPWLAGAATAAGLVLLGNLGEVRLLWRGMLSVSTIDLPRNVLFGLTNLIHGLWGGWRLLIGQASLPYSTGDWYWLPSRAIPVALDAAGIPLEAEPITEFPFFTFLYGDLHAHMIAMPITLLALAAAVALVLRPRTVERWREFLPVMFVGVLAAGALRPTNTWDFPVQLGLILLAVGYSNWQSWQESKASVDGARVVVRGLAQMTLAVVLAFVLYQPYSQWNVQGYTAVEVWHGSKTPLDSYLIVHGLFLFVLVSFMIWQTREWMARTPLSRFSGARPGSILAGVLLIGVLAAAAVALLYLSGYQALSLALPLLVWAGLLALRREQNAATRAILILASVGLALTALVEVIVLKGDVSRMNTVFKFYLQVWLLFGVAAGPALAWAVDALNRESHRLRGVWQAALLLLVLGAGYYTYKAGLSKIQDRMALEAPRTLDGMTFMAYAGYADRGKDFSLREDYDAIRWMQENVDGSPVIVEANTVEYHWGSRFTIYTGLPGVVGWNWHQRQQRGVVSTLWVEDRVREIGDFYTTPDEAQAVSFLARYDVAYVIVGQLERAYYPEEGLAKFERMTQAGLLRRVYSEGETVIYEVAHAS